MLKPNFQGIVAQVGTLSFDKEGSECGFDPDRSLPNQMEWPQLVIPKFDC